jgi:tetratricopeptide (TPR) repeat protein
MKLRSKIRERVLIAGLILLTIFIYFNTLKSDFTNYDDDTHITKNEDIKSLDPAHLKKIFTSYYVGMYQPATTLTFAIEYRFFKYNPLFYHLNNLLLHLLNVLLVFWLIKILTKRHEAALITALLFAVHPMHVESVAWITERKDVLYSFFYLLSLIFYLRYIDKPKIRLIVLSFVFFVFSCLSKSAAVTLPVILIVIELYRDQVKNKKLILLKIPFFITAFAFGLISILSQGALESKTGMAGDYSVIERIAFAGYSFVFYLGSFIFPYKLSAFHPFPIITGKTIDWFYYFIGACSVLILTGGYFLLKFITDKNFKRNLLFDFLLFLVPILLVLQVPVGSALVAERYTYLPYIGLGLIIFRLYDKYYPGMKTQYKRVVSVAACLFILTLIVQAKQRVNVWKNSYVLNDDIIGKHPENAPIAYNNRALARVGTGDYRGALDDISKSIQQSANFAEAYQNRAYVKVKLNDPGGAIADYNFAISLNPKKPNWYLNRGIARELLSDYQGAIADYSIAINLDKNYEKAYIYRADDWYVLEQFQNAVSDLNMAISLNPKNIEAYTKRCFSLIKLNKINEACADCSFASGAGDKTASAMLETYCR